MIRIEPRTKRKIDLVVKLEGKMIEFMDSTLPINT